MENLVMYGGYFLSLVLFVILLIFYFGIKRIIRIADAQRSALSQNRDYMEDVKCSLYQVNRQEARGLNDHEISTDIKNLVQEIKELEEKEEIGKKNETMLRLVRDGSLRKNLVISKQKKRILEFECAYEGLKSSDLLKEYEYFSKLLTMARKETIKKLEKRLNKNLQSDKK